MTAPLAQVRKDALKQHPSPEIWTRRILRVNMICTVVLTEMSRTLSFPCSLGCRDIAPVEAPLNIDAVLNIIHI